MTLRMKTLMIMGGALVALLAGVYLTASWVLLRGFGKIDEDNARGDVHRVLRGVEGMAAELDRSATDWARWDDAYAFVTGANPRFRAVNLVASTFADLDLDLIVFVDTGGEMVYGGSRPLHQGQAGPLPPGLASLLQPGALLLRHAHTESSQCGLVLLPGNVLLVAARPVLDSEGAGPIGGTLVFGRLIGEEVWKDLGSSTQATITVHRLDGGQAPADFREASAAVATPGRPVVRPLGDGWVAGYAALEDVFGKPALLLRAEVPRLVLTQGQDTLRFLIGALLLVVLGFGLLPLLLMERTVISRLALVSREVATIGAARDPSARLTVRGRDELASLAGSINLTLDALEEAQRERGESEQRYRAVVEQAWDGIFLVDLASRKFLEANSAFLGVLGLGAEDLGGLDLSGVQEGDAAAMERDLARISEEVRCYLGERRFRRRDGSSVVLELAASRVALRGRDVVCGVTRDTSERRRIEEQLLQSQRMEAVGRLAGGVAHDVNNILQAVVAGVERLRARGAEAGPRREVAESLGVQVARGATLTRDLSLLARQQSFRPEPLELNVVVREASEFLRRVVRENIRFSVDLAAEELYTEGDRGRLQQALVNLVINASEAIPEGGMVTIMTGKQGAEEVWFQVTDSGRAIPDEVRPRVFEPFFTTRGRGRANGLGLAVVNGIVAEHGGAVEVESSPGTGTTFKVSLPRRTASPRTLEQQPSPSRVAEHGMGGRVLLVEDEEGARVGLTDMLRLLGCEVVAVGSGEEAEPHAAEHEFDLLLTDFMLPGMSGSELARRLLERRPEMKVVVMSGYAEDEMIRRGVAAGRVRYLPKPFGIDRLSQELHAALSE